MALKNIPSIIKFSRIVIFFICFICSQILYVKDSNAGVLFRNNRNVIRIGGVQSNMQQYVVRRSTQIMRRSGGNNLKARPLGGVPATMKLVVANHKYEQKLAKWEDKKYKENLKLAKKKEALEKKEAKRRELEAKRNGKKGLPDTQLASNNSSGSITSAASKAGSRGALGTSTTQTSGAPKKGFWASLLQAIFGKSS